MPLFRWDAGPSNDVVNHRFWIYWAVAVPLTIVTFFTWLLWFKFEATQERREDEVALAPMHSYFEKSSKKRQPVKRFSGLPKAACFDV